MSILSERETYKPLEYPWAYEYYMQSERMHWIPEEVRLDRDIRDWNSKMSPEQINLVTNIFRFFTQGDVDVAKGYIEKFMPMFPKPELRMMMSSFAAREATHIEAYALLIDTLGMPETEFSAFLEYEVMMKKHDYVENFNPHYDLNEVDKDDHLREMARTLAVYPAFTEGLQLFSSFVMLLSFQRPEGGGIMNGMGEIVEWSIKDESLHVEGMLRLFEAFISEYPYIWDDDLRGEIYQIARDMVEMEDAFIDLAFEMGEVPGMEKEEIKGYIRYIADRRLNQLGLKSNWKIKNNPLPWVDEIINSVVHSNFFESRATEYGKGAVTGDWQDIWGNKSE